MANKKILVTGANSYIGKNFIDYISSFDDYSVEAISVRDDSWKDVDFGQYDVVYDVAGIAHIKETDENRHLYYEVNRDLAVALAKKAKAEGVKQFIYLSSMSVFAPACSPFSIPVFPALSMSVKILILHIPCLIASRISASPIPLPP